MLYLASQSPRRRELLARLGLPFDILDLDLPEQRAPGESPSGYVYRVAQAKARAGFDIVRAEPDAVVIGADTEVILGDEVFGKPRDEADAHAMLRRLSGVTHEVVSVVSLVSASRERQIASLSQVTFGDLDDADIAAYVDTGEALGKAGAYGIQGAAQVLVSHLSGSPSGVMGLPLFETAKLLREFGFAILPGLDGASTPASISLNTDDVSLTASSVPQPTDVPA